MQLLVRLQAIFTSSHTQTLTARVEAISNSSAFLFLYFEYY
jgi:hypothetical protein